MKTVFLFLRQGISNRNLLRTDFLKTLRANPEVRTVIISPIGAEAEFRREFECANVCVEKWPRTRVRFLEKRVKNLKDYVWVSRGLTEAIRVRRLAQRGKLGLAWRDGLGKGASLLGLTERRINAWEMALYRSEPAMAQLYERYQPDLAVFTRVFGTNMHMVKEAKMRGVKVLCLVESWDNFICKGPLSVVPDLMAVWNQGMVDEAADLHDFPREKVQVVGVPQFDLYTDKNSFLPRAEFFHAHDLNPQQKLITYAASTEGFIPNEPDIVETVYQTLQRGSTGHSCQLMLRLHPITSQRLREEYYRRFAGRPSLTIQEPGRLSKLHDGWDPSWADMVNLASTIFHSDVVVNIASTMAIDAAVLDKPVISLAFGRDPGAENRYFDDIFRNSHYKKLVDTQGLRLVYSPDELEKVVDGYLNNPMIDRAGRTRLRRELCFRLDGGSGRRAAYAVLQAVGFDAGVGAVEEPEIVLGASA